jgi:predicted alpha/beta superfamily hydrolase
MTSVYFGVLMFLTGATTLCVAQPSTVRIPSSTQYDLRAKGSGRAYRVFVAVPQGYVDRDTTRYPVLYVLDGNDAFPLAVASARFLELQHEIPDLIIVGIGYPVEFYSETLVPRYLDYTPSADTRADSTLAPSVAQARPNHIQEPLHSGGASAFLEALRDDILPFIEARYRTTADRGLWGHSFGAAFAMYTMFTAPDLFARYALCSPSLWWNKGNLYALEDTFATRHRSLSARVFVSVGLSEGKGMIAGVDSLTRLLERHAYAGLELTAHAFDGETHMSSVPAAMSRSLRVLYGQTSRK